MPAQTPEDSSNYELIIDSLKVYKIIEYGKEYIGKPYRFVTPDNHKFDCSGFLQYICQKEGVVIPSSSEEIARIVQKKDIEELQRGDLIFFEGRYNSKVGHVAMVLENHSGRLQMMHSCARGVRIEYLNDLEYYVQRVKFGGSIPALYNPLTISNEKMSEYQYGNEPTEIEVNADSLSQKTNPHLNVGKKIISITAVGDIMLGTNFPSSTYLPPQNKNILLPVNSFLAGTDIIFGNLEGCILSDYDSLNKCGDQIQNCYAFKMPDEYVHYLTEAGFNLLSVANNHIGDFGPIGRMNTAKLLQENNIHYAGLADKPYTTFVIDSVRYGFVAFSPNKGTVDINDYDNAKDIVAHLDSVCDIVIVSIHAGAEGAKMSHITRETELYLGEDRGNPYEFSRMVIDVGADVILGHGPHVTRAIDIYKGKIIAYSLGNFATYSRFNISGINGIAPIIKLNLKLNGDFISGKIIPIKQIGEGVPQYDKEGRVIMEIIKLNKEDIPESALQIDSDGNISLK